MKEKECLYCGKEFIGRTNKQKFCSNTCNSRYYGEKSRKYRTCKRCGESFWTPDASDKRSRYCPKCFELNKQDAERKCEEKAIKHYLTKTCPFCGIEFQTTISTKILCGNKECKKKYNSVKSYEHSYKKKLDKVYVCKLCGKEFQVEYGNKDKAYCCEEHKNISMKERSRPARKRYQKKRQEQMNKAFVSPVYLKKLYERDKGICGICGRPVAFDKNPSSKWALTRDHIIPISKGGKHCMDNCQIAHRICNSYKLDHIDFHIDWDKLENLPEKERKTVLYGTR